MARGYFTTKISENLEETPEKFLIAPGCVIGRTGWQAYKISDLPQEAARDMGVDMSNPDAEIDLYRSPEEVFHPDTLRSFEGKTLTDDHPEDFVNPQNFTQYARGHVQNVRKGTEPLESGEWPMLGDLHINGEPLLSKVRNKQKREISLGYDYSIRKDGDRILMVDIVGNHTAIVPKGRAGPEARIQDAAPDAVAVDGAAPTLSTKISTEAISNSIPAPPAVERAATSSTSTAVQPKKEIKPVANILKHLLGLGLKSYAVDAEPEALATAVEAINQKPPAERARAADAGDGEEEPVVDRKVKDRKGKGKDGDPAIGAPPDEDHEPADDKRKGAHDALDRMLDARDAKGKDADIEELKGLLDEYLSEEEDEPEHMEEPVADLEPLDAMMDNSQENEFESEDTEGEPGETVVESGEEELEPGAEDAEEDMECAHCGEAMDGEACPSCGCRDAKARDRSKARDRGRAADAVDGARAVLTVLRPFVARSKDTALKNAFNASLGKVTRTSRATTGGYGRFADAARARDKKLPREPQSSRGRAADSGGAGKDPNAALQAAYDSALKGGK